MVKTNYLFADIHDDVEALSAFVDYVQAQGDADRLICLGDFSLRPYASSDLQTLIEGPRGEADIKKFIDSKKNYNERLIKEMKGILDESGIDYSVIPGNYDSEIRDIFGEKDLHKNVSRFEEAKVFGYGGADAFPPHIQLLDQLGEIVEFDHSGLYDMLNSEKPDIVISHNPPKGLCDDMFNGQNVGTPAISKYIAENFPKLVLGGHIHEAGPFGNNPNGVKGIKIVGDGNGKQTVIVNPGNLGRFELVNMPSLEKHIGFPYGTFVKLNIEGDGTLRNISQYSLTGVEGKGNIGNVENIGEFDLA